MNISERVPKYETEIKGFKTSLHIEFQQILLIYTASKILIIMSDILNEVWCFQKVLKIIFTQCQDTDREMKNQK